METMKRVIDLPLSEFVSKLLAIRVMRLLIQFLKELADTHHPEVIARLEKIVLESVYSIALFDYENTDPDRGRYMIAKEPTREQQQYGNSIFRLCLECIFVWAVWFPHYEDDKPTQYLISKQKLVQKGVQCPKLSFFNVDVVKHLFRLKRMKKEDSTGLPQLDN